MLGVALDPKFDQNGWIYVNHSLTETGNVRGWIVLTNLLPQSQRMGGPHEAVLNGIAYDSKHKRLFVTGKLWPKLFEIELVQVRREPGK